MTWQFQYIYRIYWCLRVAWDTSEKKRTYLRYEHSFIWRVTLASNSKGTNMSYKCTENVEPQAQSRQLWGRVSTLLPWTIKLRKRSREAFPSFINRYIPAPALDHACIGDWCRWSYGFDGDFWGAPAKIAPFPVVILGPPRPRGTFLHVLHCALYFLCDFFV